MKRIRSLSAAIMIVALMILSACTNSTSIPRSDVTVTLNGASSDTPMTKVLASRTLLPEEMPEISTYTISIAQVSGNGVVPESDIEYSFDDGSLTKFTLPNVPLGTYTIVVEGLDTNAKLAVRGTGDDNFVVSADGKNSVNVDLSLISENGVDENLTGYASMTFDWSAVASNENIKKAMADGGLVFYLYYYDEQKNDWSEPVKSQSTGTSATSYEFKAELPVSTGLRLKYALATADEIMLNPSLTSTIAQIYSGLVSVQKGTDGYVYYITDNEISSATNVYNVTYEYGTGDNRGTSVILKWNNQMQNGKSLFNKVIVRYTSTSGDSGEKPVTVSPNDSTSSIEITGMTPGAEYTFTFEAYHTSGLISPIYTYEEKVMTEVIVKAPVVTATPSGASIVVSWAAVDNATTYTVERKEGSGSFSIVSDKKSATTYTDTDVVAGGSYSYRVKAYGESVESEYSNETTAIDIAGSIVTINPPSAVDYDDFELTVNGPDVLVLTNEEPLTFSVSEIEGVSEYIWLLNGEEAGTGTSITIDINNQFLDRHLVGSSQKLILAVKKASGLYSSEEIKFGIGKDSIDTGITINYDGATRVSSESAKGTARTFDLSEYVTVEGGSNVIKDVTYSVTGGNKALASVNSKTGVITFANPTDDTTNFSVTITATSFAGYADDITFDIYKPTITSAKQLLDIINTDLKEAIKTANDDHKDWWTGDVNFFDNGELGQWTVTRYPGYTIKSCTEAKQKAGSIIIDKTLSSESGLISIKNTLSIYASDEGKEGYLDTDKLKYVGYGNESLSITLPFNQGQASIKYNKVDIQSESQDNAYEVTLNDKILGYNMEIIPSATPIKFNYSESINLLP